ncbi:hypothetical protein [Geodermatophilus sabuli]|uniref:Phage integrase, N-terminal SAM-like domain n=1 Tax=Geodermatophilus sabuli TaxID=1564158 RepID=A0A285E754_9ACTN|nr:hypothetical protein [Geodermatophilus sabuli]MBB3082301.1 hypothetical protein [Geodermatophilus sabuli]SNX94827.1 hypothetical protein SAMN06893097_101624 [Geodermatophilus sabuli]
MPAAHRSAAAMDDLSVLLPDWCTHLRARNVAPSTIQSYLTVGENLLTWLRAQGMPATASDLGRDHLDVPGHQVGASRLIGGRPPSALWRR